MAGLDAPLSDFWLYTAEPPGREKEPPRYVPSNVYREGKAKLDREGKAEVGKLVSLNELLSENMPRLAQYYRKCWRKVAQTINRDKRPVAPAARDKAIVSHWREAEKKCRLSCPKPTAPTRYRRAWSASLQVWNRWGPDAIREVCDSSD